MYLVYVIPTGYVAFKSRDLDECFDYCLNHMLLSLSIKYVECEEV